MNASAKYHLEPQTTRRPTYLLKPRYKLRNSHRSNELKDSPPPKLDEKELPTIPDNLPSKIPELPELPTIPGPNNLPTQKPTVSGKTMIYVTKPTVKIVRAKTVPDKPEAIIVSEIHKDHCKLTWKAPKYDGGEPVTAYLVDMQDMVTGVWSPYGETNGKTLVMKVVGLVPGKEYRFRVRAINKEGESKALVTFDSIVAKDPTKPDAPEGPLVVSEIHKNNCKLTWKPPKYDGGTSILSYQVQMSERETGTWRNVNKTAGDVTEMIVGKLIDGTEYRFRVKATNKIGESLPLETFDSFVAKDPTLPGKPEGPLQITDIRKDRCKVSWKPPKNDGGSRILVYNVEMVDLYSGVWLPVKQTRGNVTEVELDGLIPHNEYKFRVKAVNKQGVSDTLESFGSIIAMDPRPKHTCPTLPTTTTTTTKKRTTRPFDVEMFLEIVANLTYDYYTNLTQQLNMTFQKMSAPTCPPKGEYLTTLPTSTGVDYSVYNDSLRAKCFVCGLNTSGVPYDADCADAFAGDFIPLVYQSPTAKGHIGKFRKYCLFQDINNYFINESMSRMMFGRWTGGCSVRWTDVSGIYTQRTCRSKYKATVGKSYASKRMAKLEMTLQHTDNGCIISPVATLIPLSRAISLYARFHVCVCTGSWCNTAPTTLSAILSTMPASILFAMTVTVLAKIVTS